MSDRWEKIFSAQITCACLKIAKITSVLCKSVKIINKLIENKQRNST